MKSTREKVIIAMSGGVDSSVSAYLLKRDGFDVTGVFMKCWSEEPCTAKDDEMWARRAAAKIGLPFYSIDLVEEYNNRVMNYFVHEYKNGRTPNPDVMCNREIKFGVFYDWAINQFGADYLATGHYARRKYTGQTRVLLKGRDPGKDQSYFLWAVDREKFKKTLFPVGDYMKRDVRKIAKNIGLPNAERRDSQGVCFVGELPMGVFLKRYMEDKPGVIMDTNGHCVGEHKGLHFYTIGQRRGINIGGGPPYYVTQKNYKDNSLIVAREYDDDLFSNSLTATSLNWIAKEPKLPFSCKAKIRYRQDDQDVILESKDKIGKMHIKFPNPQRAVTSGQSIVFYKNDVLLGGGVIS